MTQTRTHSLLFAAYFLLLASTVAQSAENDECVSGKMISQVPFSTQGDTSTATIDFEAPTDNLRNLTCGVSSASRGVWYQISLEESKLVRATLSDTLESTVGFNAVLFQGDDCDNLDCLEGRQYELINQRNKPTLTWYARAGETYHLHVTGFKGTDVGQYDLLIEGVGIEPPSNDQCSPTTAKLLGVGESTALVLDGGNTAGARPHDLDLTDCGLRPDSRGLFYQFTGTGQVLDVVLVLKETKSEEQRMELAILQSGCATCVDYSDFITVDDESTTLTISTEADRIYYIAVTGDRFEDEAKFDIAIEESQSKTSASSIGFSKLVLSGTATVSSLLLFLQC